MLCTWTLPTVRRISTSAFYFIFLREWWKDMCLWHSVCWQLLLLFLPSFNPFFIVTIFSFPSRQESVIVVQCSRILCLHYTKDLVCQIRIVISSVFISCHLVHWRTRRVSVLCNASSFYAYADMAHQANCDFSHVCKRVFTFCKPVYYIIVSVRFTNNTNVHVRLHCTYKFQLCTYCMWWPAASCTPVCTLAHRLHHWVHLLCDYVHRHCSTEVLASQLYCVCVVTFL